LSRRTTRLEPASSPYKPDRFDSFRGFRVFIVTVHTLTNRWRLWENVKH
jgi:hypothetical protein